MTTNGTAQPAGPARPHTPAAPVADLVTERALLAALLRSPPALASARRRVRADDFHDPVHARVFAALVALAERGAPFDAVLLGGELGHAVAAAVLPALAAAPGAPGAVADYITRLQELACRRRPAVALATATADLAQGAHPTQVWATLAHAAQEARPPSTAITPLRTVRAQLVDSWEHPAPVTPTGLVQLDAMLAGGLRAGDLVGLAGAAANGKSALVGQLALDAAKAGAVVVYASVEMPAAEVLARWYAVEAFRAVPAGGRHAWGISYAEILYGRAWRGEDARGRPLNSPRVRDEVFARLEAARRAVDAVEDHLFATQLEPGATVDRLAALVRGARDRAPGRPAVLVVDPLQRLFAGERHGRTGRAAEAINALETERVSAVAQELKYLADHEDLAVLFTSDTTKAAALGAMSSAGSLRGSYQLNHLATVVFGLHTAPDAAALRRLLDGDDKKGREAIAEELTVDAIRRCAEPAWWGTRTDVASLGPAVAVLECSKNRRGAPRALALGFVRGATTFVEGEDLEPEDPEAAASAPARRRSTDPPREPHTP